MLHTVSIYVAYRTFFHGRCSGLWSSHEIQEDLRTRYQVYFGKSKFPDGKHFKTDRQNLESKPTYLGIKTNSVSNYIRVELF